MESVLSGELLLDNDCLRINDGYSNYLIIWPPGFSMRTEGEEIQVIDSNGKVVARVGDNIYVSGGEFPGEKAREYIEESIVGKPLPAGCPGPYWIVGAIVKTVY